VSIVLLEEEEEEKLQDFLRNFSFILFFFFNSFDLLLGFPWNND